MRRESRRRLLADLVRQRQEIVFDFALSELRRGNEERAREACKYLLELSMRTRVRPSRELKRRICKNCQLPLVPGLTASVRSRTQGRFSYMVVRCLSCGYIHRYPYKRGKGREEGEGEGYREG
ncbi:MAG: ribonuclease P [Acidilobaceae archaeon]